MGLIYSTTRVQLNIKQSLQELQVVGRSQKGETRHENTSSFKNSKYSRQQSNKKVDREQALKDLLTTEIIWGNIKSAQYLARRKIKMTNRELVEVLNRSLKVRKYQKAPIKSTIKFILDQSTKLDPRGGDNLLYEAIASDHFKVVKSLLSFGISANTSFRDESRPLQLAISRRQPKICKILIQHGANVEVTDALSRRPIHLAAKLCADCVRCLIQHEVQLDVQDFFGYTALHYAVSRGLTEAVRLLLEAGANIEITTTAGDTPFSLALIRCDLNNYTYYDESTQMIGVQMIKNNMAGIRVNSKNLQILLHDIEELGEESLGLISKQFSYNLNEFQNELNKEIVSMKILKMSSTLSLFDIFITRNTDYRCDKTLVEKLETVDYEMFPQYGSMIRRKLKSDEKRYNTIDGAKKFFEVLTKLTRTINAIVVSGHLNESY